MSVRLCQNTDASRSQSLSYVNGMFAASESITRFMHIPGIEFLNLAGGTASGELLLFVCALVYLVSTNLFVCQKILLSQFRTGVIVFM